MRGGAFPGLSASISSLLDDDVPDERLERVARLTAAKFIAHARQRDNGRTWTFLFRGRGTYVYIVLPIYRERYYAVVRVEGLKTTLAGGNTTLTAEDFETQSISVLEADALRLACHALSEEP
jgi:hypothetical protein